MVRKITSFFLAATLFVACSKNAVTGRKQFKFLPEAELQSMATQQYQQFLQTNRVVSASNDRDAEMVRRVGQRIARAVEGYYQQQGLSDALKDYHWEYNLVDNKEANAWCMPGGKIVVYTGLLPITQNEAGLAVVVGHEVSHAIFQHGNERMSQALAQQLGGVALSVALSQQPAQTQELFMQAYGVGSAVGVLLPFSRKHELEADRYGIRWAAIAGYNPREAIALWQRMQKMANSNRPPEFLSTHPAEAHRIQQLEKYMNEALKYYKPVNR
ncbi:MAG: M48 family metallopeptidase [Chitinophagaceae bacterium]|nr:M48 family metallopeptidase [Chitinophagaceae bacterium]